jgi:phosphatidylserine/phosphatidylglycerophosphate/cardiolipin synthase-like enzyme
MADVTIHDVAFADRCETVVRRFIDESEGITGCVAWMTNPNIIDALSRLQHCRLVVTADGVHNRIPALHRLGVRQVGQARGRYRALMHHKFLVRITRGEPTHVLVGSYNFTRHSNHNIGESIIVLKCARTARQFYEEAERALRGSRPIRAHAVR